MFKRKKIKDILTAEELLRVDPKDIGFNKTLKILLVSIITIGFLYLIVISLDVKLIFIFSIFYSILLVSIILLGKKTQPLIFTERGIVKAPYLAEYWEDLEKYCWEEFTKLKKAPFAPKTSPVCLYLINKGISQRSVERWTGHTMLAQYGIFFNGEQIKKAEELFKKYGISKIDKE